MSFSERPPLHGYTCERIDSELYEVDKRHWPRITAMRVKRHHSVDEPVPPQKPEHLLLEIRLYAEALFKAEADHYYDFHNDPGYREWLYRLQDRVKARAMKSLDTLESGGTNILEHVMGIQGGLILGYHGLTIPGVEAELQTMLVELCDQYERGIAPGKTSVTVKGSAAQVPTPESPPLIMAKAAALNATPGKQETTMQPRLSEALDRLLNEARWKPELIAEKVGINPRNVYRHLSGETLPTLSHVGLYESALSKELGRKVKLPTPAKRPRASKMPVIRQ